MPPRTIPDFTGDLVTAAHPEYEPVRRVWNAMVDKRPGLIARCRSTADVVAAVSYARSAGMDLAVRGGGHSIAGLSSIDGGMMLDLQPMNGVVIDPDRRRAHVQGGALLGDLDRAAQHHGLATTGGMVHHTGVGGLTLGGGFGWLARLHGLACDNLVAATVVTAAGNVVTASNVEHPDLFWAIRGGGGNFGVVTQFEFELHPVNPMVSVQRRYRADDAPAVLRAYRDFMASAPREICSLVGVESGRGAGRLEAGGGTDTELYVWYVDAGGAGNAADQMSAALRAAAKPLAEQAEILPYVELQSSTGDASGPGRRHYWKGSLMWDLSDEFLDTFLERGRRTAPGCGVEVFSLGGAISSVDEDATAYSHRDATFELLPAATWDDPRDDEACIAVTREHWNALSVFGRNAVYVNDLGGDSDSRINDAYGSSKLERLTALKRLWDPENVFRAHANIAPQAER